MFHVPEKYRITKHKNPLFNSDESYGNNGCFEIPLETGFKLIAHIIASDGEGWEHVSVHVIADGSSVIPRWGTMCEIKNIFWDEEDTVIQYHPAKTDYVNNHHYVLHLWRPIGIDFPKPPKHLIGI
jgi:hypothetical protein